MRVYLIDLDLRFALLDDLEPKIIIVELLAKAPQERLDCGWIRVTNRDVGSELGGVIQSLAFFSFFYELLFQDVVIEFNATVAMNYEDSAVFAFQFPLQT